MYCNDRSVNISITRVNNKCFCFIAMISLHMLTFRLMVSKVAEFFSLGILITLTDNISSITTRKNECTKVQNPWRHVCANLENEHAIYAHVRFPQENDGPYVCFQRSSSGSLQRSGFRENPTNFLIFIAREYVTVFSGRTEVRCDLTDRRLQ